MQLPRTVEVCSTLDAQADPEGNGVATTNLLKPRVFVSYSQPDWIYAKHIFDALSHEGYEVWWDQNIQLGDRWAASIRDSLSEADIVVVLVSKAFGESAGMALEIGTLVERRESGSHPIVLAPVLIRSGEPQLGILGQYQYVDARGDAPAVVAAKVVEALRALPHNDASAESQRKRDLEYIDAMEESLELIERQREVATYQRDKGLRSFTVASVTAALVGVLASVVPLVFANKWSIPIDSDWVRLAVIPIVGIVGVAAGFYFGRHPSPGSKDDRE